jgi:hypothetical protein
MASLCNFPSFDFAMLIFPLLPSLTIPFPELPSFNMPNFFCPLD